LAYLRQGDYVLMATSRAKKTTDGIVMKILSENESLDSELSIKFCKSFGSALVKVCTLRVFSSINLFNRFLTLSLIFVEWGKGRREKKWR